MQYLLTIAFSVLLASSAFAAEQSKAEQSAIFRVKVANCKAQAKAHAVATSSAEFFSYMGECVDRVTVAVSTVPTK
jgi:hypothetical protein